MNKVQTAWLAGFRRKFRAIDRRYREARMFARAMVSPRHPIVAHIIPTRRCNLSCAYCNEYNDYSPPVPVAAMLRRIDLLARLGTTIITISGGEPLLHPQLDQIVGRIRRHGIMATVITNGYLLSPDRIRALNRAGLDYLQISVDNLMPDDVSKKSLKVLDQKLQWLACHAEFAVTVNSVLGAGMRQPEDALAVTRRARQFGFTSTVGVIHDHSGQLKPLSDDQRRVYEEILALGKSVFSFAHYDRFQDNIVRGLPNDWQCHAGGRYLYVCEDGLVHWCSQQRGHPGIPLEQYTPADLDREYGTVKPCAAYCTVSCVHQTSLLDGFRERPREALAQIVSSLQDRGASLRPPRPVQLLRWMFLESGNRRIFKRIALRILKVTRD